jgi:hypothetical protein
MSGTNVSSRTRGDTDERGFVVRETADPPAWRLTLAPLPRSRLSTARVGRPIRR